MASLPSISGKDSVTISLLPYDVLSISHRGGFKLFCEYDSAYLSSNAVFQADKDAFFDEGFWNPENYIIDVGRSRTNLVWDIG